MFRIKPALYHTHTSSSVSAAEYLKWLPCPHFEAACSPMAVMRKWNLLGIVYGTVPI